MNLELGKRTSSNYVDLQNEQKQPNIKCDNVQFELSCLRIGRVASMDLKKMRQHSLDTINEKAERLHNEKVFRKLEEERKKHLRLIPQKSRFTKKILFTIVNTVFQSVIALIAGIVYVVHTYYRDNPETEPTFTAIESFIALIFLIDYIHNFRKAKNKLKFFFKPIYMFDFITITPVLISILPGTDSSVGNFLKQFIGIVRILRVFRVFRIYKLSKERNEESFALKEYWEIKRKSFVVLSSLFLSIFICAGLIQAFTTMGFGFDLNDTDSPLTFDEALYFITVTCSTVGYGDYHPQNELSQFMILIFIIVVIFIVSKTTSDFNEITKSTSEYKLPYFGQKKKHILLIGKVDHLNLLKFAKEFYHPDNDANNTTPILVMTPQEPSDEMKFLIKSPFFQDKISYIIGNPLRVADLKLAKLSNNKVIIIADQFSKTSQQDDVFPLLVTQLIKEMYPRCKIYTQINCPENMYWSFWLGWEKVTCTNQIKMGLISTNSFIPGFSTMISNLIMSFSESNHMVTDYSPWKIEYIHGMNHEIYLLKFKNDKNQYYVGKQFKQVCLEIFQKTGILLIGLKIKNIGLSRNQADYYDTLLNPINHVIYQDDIGIILAKDIKHCQTILTTPPLNQNEYIVNQQDDEDPKYGSKMAFEELDGQCEYQNLQSKSEGKLEYTTFDMSIDDVRGSIKGHILVFGEIEYLQALVIELRSSTDRHICFVSKNEPNEKWEIVKRKFPKLYYFTCHYFNIQELEKTAIEDAYSCIVLGGQEGSDFQDSRILPLANIIEENFPNLNFTIEMANEKNVKYLVSKNLQFKGDSTKSNYLNPLFASSRLFYSATLDYLMGKIYHVESISDIILKMVSPQSLINHSDTQENNEIGLLKIPDHLANRANYQQVFHYFLNQNYQVIPIAIFRAPHVLDNQFSFIYTNPSPLAPMLKGDILIVIGDIGGRQQKDFNHNSFHSHRDLSKTLIRQGSSLNHLKADLSNIGEIAEEILQINDKFNISDPLQLEECLQKIGVSKQQHTHLMEKTEELRKILQSNKRFKQKIQNQEETQIF